MSAIMLNPGDPRIPERRSEPLGLAPDADRRRPLWAQGRVEVLGRPSIGIVGTRRPSPHGISAARRIAFEVARSGWCVVSGLALGIDEAAHLAAVEAGGETIAVLPSPAPLGLRYGARRLAEQIQQAGLLLSDRPVGTPPAAWSFAARNHLLAALCDGLIVVEAPEGSGALITAESAAGLGLPIAIVSAPYGAATAEGGLRWLQRTQELSLRLTEERSPVLISGEADLRAWLAVCALSLHGHFAEPPEVASVATSAVGGEASGLQREILQRVDAAGAEGVVEGDLSDLSRELPGALVAALTLLSLRGLVEQRGGRWRRVLGAVLRSRP
ncbi:MAG: DNA-processing protein DprA [Chloroflexi bacterium]|nr:DNA-processing protein DprA [Chloroflexota bacterium]